jgi:hypothetical protein
MITKLGDNQIFVFGSNLAGKHIGGAAALAHEKFGAKLGWCEGLTGKSYAFPTLDKSFQQVSQEQLEKSRDNLYATAKEFPKLEFLLTPVGTGIAKFSFDVINELFKNLPSNIKKLW